MQRREGGVGSDSRAQGCPETSRPRGHTRKPCRAAPKGNSGVFGLTRPWDIHTASREEGLGCDASPTG